MFEKEAKSGAKKICGIGTCICAYPCGHQNRKERGLKLYGENQKCPLEKYNVIPDKRKFFDIPYKESNPSPDELFALCANCQFAEVEEFTDHYEVNMKSLEKYCIDCPVNLVRESMQELAAEAAMS